MLLDDQVEKGGDGCVLLRMSPPVLIGPQYFFAPGNMNQTPC